MREDGIEGIQERVNKIETTIRRRKRVLLTSSG